IGGYTIVSAPVIGNGRPGNLEQPLLYTLHAAFLVDSAHGFYKYLRRQILGLFPVANLAVDIAINQAQILLIQRLKFLHCRPSNGFSPRCGNKFCLLTDSLFTAQCTHNVLLPRLVDSQETGFASYYAGQLHQWALLIYHSRFFMFGEEPGACSRDLSRRKEGWVKLCTPLLWKGFLPVAGAKLNPPWIRLCKMLLLHLSLYIIIHRRLLNFKMKRKSYTTMIGYVNKMKSACRRDD